MSSLFAAAYPQKIASQFLNPMAQNTHRYRCGDYVINFHTYPHIASHNDCTLAFSGNVYQWPQNVKDTSQIPQILLEQYRQNGLPFLKSINGDFSLVLLDRAKNKIIIARDPLGVLPMYVYAHAGIFAFANGVEVFKQVGFSLSANEGAIGRFFVFKYSPGSETLYREVKKLRPGTAMEIDLTTGVAHNHRYWDVFENLPRFTGSFADACAELRHLMEISTRRRMSHGKPMANFLSGGLDSSILAHYLKDTDSLHYCAVKHTGDLQAEGTTSDGYFAKKLAKEWNLHLDEIEIGAHLFSEQSIRRAVLSTPDLIADGSIIPALLMAERAAQKSDVVWSGMGADELFLGYNGHYLLKLSQMAAHVPGLQSVLAKVFKNISAGRGPLKAYRRYLQKWGNNVGKPFAPARYSIVGDVDWALRITKTPADLEEFLSPYFPQGRDSFESLLAFELDNFLVKNLHYLYFSGLESGLEARVPFLDVDVVRFAASLPVSYKMDALLTSKKVLKRAYQNELPSYITRRRKAGFGMPLRSLLAHSKTLETLLPFDYFSDHPCFNPDAIRDIITLHQSGKQDHSALIYALICFRIWEASF